MNFKTRFLEAVQGRRYPWPREAGDFPEAPALQDDDVNFILAEHIRRKYEGRKYITGGNSTGPGKETRSRGKAGGISRLIRALLNKKDRLQREVKELEDETISEK